MNHSSQQCALDARLQSALQHVEYPILFEPSVKAVQGNLVTGRYLLSFPRAALGPGPKRKLRQMLIDLGTPPEGLARLDLIQSGSRSVHFGYEPDPSGTLIKCYLEFPPNGQPLPDLTFLAIKWRHDGTLAETLYFDRDASGPQVQDNLLCDVVPEGRVRSAMLRLADMTRVHSALRFLEVVEPGSARRSIDINLSESNATLGSVQAFLSEFLGGGDDVDAYLRTHANDKIGHIAAGTTRDGNPFGTLYHGAHRLMGPL